RIGVSAREVARALRHGEQPATRAQRRGGADAYAAPGFGDDDAAPAQLGEGRRDRARAEADLGGQPAHRGQPLAGRELAAADGQPLVLPMLHARRGGLVYLHGSAGGRTLRALRAGTPACLTVSLLDGLVLARAAMHHSANYRSVVLLGRARAVEDPEEKRLACREIVEHVVPGRWEDVRPPSENELKATAIVALPIDQASAKIRSGPPLDDEADRDLPAWAGVIPLGMRAGTPDPDPALAVGV